MRCRAQDPDSDNPIRLQADKVALDSFSSFRSSENSTLNASHWTKSGNASDGNVSNPDSDVQSLRVSTDGITSGNSYVATFENVSITSDASKRIFWATTSVNSIENTSQVQIRVIDADGDHKSTRSPATARLVLNLARERDPWALTGRLATFVQEVLVEDVTGLATPATADLDATAHKEARAYLLQSPFFQQTLRRSSQLNFISRYG